MALMTRSLSAVLQTQQRRLDMEIEKSGAVRREEPLGVVPDPVTGEDDARGAREPLEMGWTVRARIVGADENEAALAEIARAIFRWRRRLGRSGYLGEDLPPPAGILQDLWGLIPDSVRKREEDREASRRQRIRELEAELERLRD